LAVGFEKLYTFTVQPSFLYLKKATIRRKYLYLYQILTDFCGMAKQPIITVKNLVKKYDDFTAVNGISFDVYEGEIFGLLGPNGAGKTTTLEIIETLREKTSGEIMVDGFNIETDTDSIKKRIGVQLQAAGYYPNLNLTELIELFSGLYGVDVSATQMLHKVALTDKAKAKYKELSGGQKQRFSIATTLINNPRIVFLDEPTTGLDPQARRNLWDLIREIRDNGTTVVITTHYMDEAEVLCDRVAFVDGGNIIGINTPDAFIDELVASGFERSKEVKAANLEDVFIAKTGKEWRES
jgi:ABC-2 type transport system ATP-binding protein